jgi:ligand-binding sensor domain-containing protein
MKYLSILVLVVFSALFLSCEQKQNPKWIKFTYLKSVSHLAIDENYLWAISVKGLIKINIRSGESHLINDSTLGFPHRYIRCMVVANERNLWINAVYSLIKLGEGEQIHYDSSNSCIPQQHISESIRMYVKGNKIPVWYPTTIHKMITEKNGTVWITTNGSELIKFKNGNCEIINKSNSDYPGKSITALDIDNFGNKWLGTDGKILKYNDSTFIEYKIPNDPRFHHLSYPSFLLINNKNELWINLKQPEGCFPEEIESILYKFDGKEWKSFTKDNSSFPSDYGIRSMILDNLDNLFIGYKDGLLKFDGKNWITYNTKNSGLLNNKVNTIVVDKYNNKWIGTDLGISIFNENGIDLEKINYN